MTSWTAYLSCWTGWPIEGPDFVFLSSSFGSLATQSPPIWPEPVKNFDHHGGICFRLLVAQQDLSIGVVPCGVDCGGLNRL